jgi:hypothetical protein
LIVKRDCEQFYSYITSVLGRTFAICNRHARCRLIFAHLIYGIDLTGAPPGHERRREGRIAEIDGDGIVGDGAARWRD